MPTQNIDDCVKPIADNWNNIVAAFEDMTPGYSVIPFCCHRTPEEQFMEFKKGRTFDNQGKVLKVDNELTTTTKDGFRLLSAHNFYPSRAVDVVVIRLKDKKQMWGDAWYDPFIKICKALGLEAGAGWKNWKPDPPHIQVPNYMNYQGS